MVKKIKWPDFIEKISSYTGVEVSELNENTNVYADLGMDSLGLFSLGMFLIKTYEIKIPLSAVATIETIGDIFAIMDNQVEDLI